MDEQKKGNPAVKVSIVVLVLVVAYFGYYKYSNNQESASSITNTQTEVPVVGITDSSNSVKKIYKDGTYEAIGTYQVPSGNEDVSVKLVVKDDVVTDATIVNNAQRPESKNYQNVFISGYKAYVIGKKIDEISVTKVSGSSLTPKGFMDALSKIKGEAKA